MAKCYNFIEITIRDGCSPLNLLHIFRTPFPKNTSGGMLLKVIKRVLNTFLNLIQIVSNCSGNVENSPKFTWNKSSHPKVFGEKGVLKNFAKFTGKHLCQDLFFNKVAGLRPATLSKKKRTLAQVFSCEFCEFSQNTSGGCFCWDGFPIMFLITFRIKFEKSLIIQNFGSNLNHQNLMLKQTMNYKTIIVL